MEHWDESTAVNGNEPSPPSTDRKRFSIDYNNPVHAFPGMVGINDYDRNPGKPDREKNPKSVVSSGGWRLQQDPADKLVTANTLSKEETIAQGEGPKRIKKGRE